MSKSFKSLVSIWLTFDVEVLRVALAVALGVGGDARVEPGLAAAHGLQHQRPVPDQDAAGDVLLHEFSLGGDNKRGVRSSRFVSVLNHTHSSTEMESGAGKKAPAVSPNSSW